MLRRSSSIESGWALAQAPQGGAHGPTAASIQEIFPLFLAVVFRTREA